MKKRLLSAALALAMMLTMLPLTAFAANTLETNKTQVQFKEIDAALDADTNAMNTAPGWYYNTGENGTAPDGKSQPKWRKVSSGVVSGTGTSGTYYTDANTALDAKVSSFRLIGTASDIDLSKVTGNTLTVDTYGANGATFSNSSTTLTTLTVTNTRVDPKTGETVNSGTVTLPSGGLTVTGRSFTLNVTNITEVTNDVKVNFESGKDVQGNLTVNVTRSKVANLTLDNSNKYSTKTNTLTVKVESGASGKITAKKSEVGDIKAINAKLSVTATSGQTELGDIATWTDAGTATAANSYTGGTIQLGDNTRGNESEAGDVTICGTGTLTVSGMSTVKSVTLYGGKKGDDGKSTAIPTSWKTTMTVSGTSTITNGITQGDKDENGHTITIQGGSTASTIDMSQGGQSTIKLDKANIGSGSGEIKIAAGTLTITDSSAGNITAGKEGLTSGATINVGASGKTDTSKVGKIIKASPSEGGKVADPTLNVYPGATVGTIDAAAAKNIYGGTLGTPADKADLRGNLSSGYQIKKGSTYTYTADFQDLVDKYDAKGDFEATLVGDAATKGATITFQWKDPSSKDTTVANSVLTTLKVSKGGFIALPTKVNGTDVTYWYNVTDQDETADGEGLAALEGRFHVESDAPDAITLVAQVGDKINQVVTGVKAEDNNRAKDNNITATLNGNTVDLSGAVSVIGDGASIKLTFEVNGKYGGTQYVIAAWDVKTGKIQLEKPADSTNIVLPTLRTNEVKVFDTVFTVTGSGLKEMPSKIELGDLDATNASNIVVPKASAGLSGDYTALGTKVKESFEDKSKSGADFTEAANVIAALNSQIAGLGQGTVDSMINEARSAMARYNTSVKEDGRNNWAASEFNGYNKVVLTPYLEVECSNPTLTGDASNTIMTLTITLKYRYTVTNSDGTEVAFTSKTANGDEVPWEKTGNLTLKTDDDGVSVTKITLTLPDTTFVYDSDPSYVHHAGRVYIAKWSSKKTTINNMNGFSNTKFEINNTAPLAVVTAEGETAKIGEDLTDEGQFLFDNLQDAVNAVKNKGTITVLNNWSGAINVTGQARSFTIKAKDDRTTVTITSVNGANTTAEFKSASNEYTIQLGSSTVTATGSGGGSITVNVSPVSNGTARVNLASANVGSTVTITATPSSGYVAVTPSVTTNTGANVTVTAAANGTYTFVVPSGASSITVTPAFVETGSAVPFTDVSTGAWYYDGVVYCYTHMANGTRLMGGFSDTNFGANRPMTRAELVEVLWRIAGSPIETAATYFSDVQSGAWYYNSVTWAANHGYVNGYGDGTMQPNRNISRQELAQILWKAQGRPTVSVNLAGRYPDGQGVAGWAQEAMQWAAGRNILSGRNSVTLSKLDAYEQAYRSELAVTIMKYHQSFVA